MLPLNKNRPGPPFLTAYRRGMLAFLCATLLCLAQPTGRVQAHGGAIITDGYTEQYEWLVAINPFPVTPGQTVITLLIYDLKTYKPVTDASAELYLAPPGSTAPCCEKGVASGPFTLTTDPVQFPGDYSATVVLGKAGQWQAKFHAVTKNGAFDALTSFTVDPGEGTYALNRGVNSTPSPATATAFAQTVDAARQGQSPLATPSLSNQTTSPLPLPNSGQNATFSNRLSRPFGRYWWVWGMLACGPIIAIFAWGLRPEIEKKN
ncbi:MAG: hypothetical protein NT075_09760 [Chloroflexi bacterium]|nr:hypothetical protein [Chloroflexota bacterium]